ncbi:60S ribosomal protein L18a-like protein isoform X2 [Iris pallida]|uniref:60S ribosomal protein L18a-like protein isoform X2 n=1 Tax=Iris pallida TaxID=29817 RepID=A0AAX6ILC7_IRIPA|nr:60S ribosomal protein L18a-like protein isoform X2 [Iris pallida]
MMNVVGKREEGVATKIPISNNTPPHYGTFPQMHHHQQQPTYHVIPAVGYQAHPSCAVVVEQGIPVSEPDRLPLCGIGIGWALFLSGFFLAAVPWYVGAFILLFVRLDFREQPGLVACAVAAALVTVPVLLNTYHGIFGW